MKIDLLKKMLADAKAGKDFAEADLAAAIALTTEDVSPFLDTDDGKKLLQPKLDQYHTKGLESWKEKNLPKITAEAADAAIKAKYPAETEEQKRIRALETENAAEKAARIHESLKNKALSVLTGKKLPVDLIDRLIGSDEDSTMANLSAYEKVFTDRLKEEVDARFKNGGRDVQPPTDPKTQLQLLNEKLSQAKSLDERVALRNEIADLEKK